VKTGRSGIRDNRGRGAVHEFIAERAVADSRLSVVSAYFTTFAYDRLRVTLDGVQSRNLIVYGENGAGKSSIYKALRGLFGRRPHRDALKNNAHVHALDPLLTPRVSVTVKAS